MLFHAMPEYPWQYVSVDLFFYRGEDYLVIVYQYSDYLELEKADQYQVVLESPVQLKRTVQPSLRIMVIVTQM